MGFDFMLVDVFSDQPFGGNRLAVFPYAEGIAAETMQKVAQEFNFPETTFVLPPDDPSHTCQVRIFTPVLELPFAGHPTVGTAAVLASLGIGDPNEQLTFEEGIGPVTVSVDGPTIRLHLRYPDYETTDEAPPAEAITKALSLPEDSITESWYAGVGLRFCFVRIANRDLVDRAALDKSVWQAEIADSWSPHLYIFADVDSHSPHVHARLFAPAVGVDEDPATGSACASLVASLAQRSPQQHGTYSLQVDQGVAMGRPSVLRGTADKNNGQLAEVAVEGCAVILGKGTMTLPHTSADA